MKLHKLGLADEYESVTALMQKQLIIVRMEANVHVRLQFQYSLLQKSIEELLDDLEVEHLLQPTRGSLLHVLD